MCGATWPKVNQFITFV